MTVKELIALLSALDPDRIVILQRDPEGNGYAPLDGVDDNTVWQAEDSEARVQTLTSELKARGFTLEDVGDGVPSVILYPEY